MTAQSNRFVNKVALVTGAASGIGKATALAFLNQGASVVFSDINEKTGNDVVAEFAGKNAKFIKCDVSDAKEVASLIANTIETFGRLDFAYNNAGIEGASAPTADQTEENFDTVIAINLKGVWLCMKHELMQMLKQKSGSIVNCSSIAGVIGFTGIAPYDASKHGVIGLTKTAALEYARSGIRINAVLPGVIWTPMVQRYTSQNPQGKMQLAAAEPLGRMGQPEEIANAVLWLCSDEASFVTGHSMIVDGGWTAQ